MTDRAVLVNSLEEEKLAIEVLKLVINLVYYIFDAKFSNFQELYEAGDRDEPVKSVNGPQCNPPYSMRRQSELKIISHNVFWPKDEDSLCDLAKVLIKSCGHGEMYCSTLQLASCLQRVQSLTEEKKVANDGEGKEFEIRQEEVIEREQTPLFYTGATGHCQQSPQMKRWHHTSILAQAIYVWLARLSYSEAVENVYYDAPVEVNTTHRGEKIWSQRFQGSWKYACARWMKGNLGSTFWFVKSERTLRGRGISYNTLWSQGIRSWMIVLGQREMKTCRNGNTARYF